MTKDFKKIADKTALSGGLTVAFPACGSKTAGHSELFKVPSIRLRSLPSIEKSARWPVFRRPP